MRSTLLVLACLLAAIPARAAIPVMVTHQGYLLDSADRPVTESGVAMSFSIWTDVASPTAANRVWPASPNTCTVPVSAGRFAVTLGGDCAPGLTSDHFPPDGERWLEVSIGGVALAPRLRLGAVPLATVATQALGLPDGAVTNRMLAHDGLEIVAGAGLTGGGAVALGESATLALAKAGASGTYMNANITVDEYGRVTAATDGAAQGVTAITAGAGLTGGTITGTGTLAVDVGTSAGKIVQLDANGRVPAALLPPTDGLNAVARGPTLVGDGTEGAPLGVADLFVRKDRVFTASGTNVAPGASVKLTHGQNTNFVLAQAWVKTPSEATWELVGGAAALPTEVGTGSDGVYNATSDTTLPAREYNFTSFTIASGRTVTVTGSQPLVIRSQGKVLIAGSLSLAGAAGASYTSSLAGTYPSLPGGAGGGGGGYPGGNGSTNSVIGTAGQGPGGGGAGGMANQGGAGGGGGHATTGSQGGAANSSSCGYSAGALGTGGAAYNSINSGTLTGGSGGGGGGSGGANDTSGASGGGGGGAVKIVASTIEITGTLTADGGKGGSIPYGPSGAAGAGGGGGAGGAIWLVGANVSVAGVVTAKGGKGGDQFTANCRGGSGGDGANGRIRIDAPFLSTSGSVTPASANSTDGLPAQLRARVVQTDANSVTVVNDGSSPLDVKVTALVP